MKKRFSKDKTDSDFIQPRKLTWQKRQSEKLEDRIVTETGHYGCIAQLVMAPPCHGGITRVQIPLQSLSCMCGPVVLDTCLPSRTPRGFESRHMLYIKSKGDEKICQTIIIWELNIINGRYAKG